MAIAAQRFRFLDQETNVPIVDFNKISDNFAYNIPEETLTELQQVTNEDAKEVLNKLQANLQSVTEQLNEFPAKLNEEINNALSSIRNLDLPATIRDALNSLTDLDLDGLKGFIKNALNLGKAVLCGNLGFLKLFLLGFSLNKNILSGLLIALLLSWLDRICSSQVTPQSRQKSTRRELTHTLFPYKQNIHNDNAFRLMQTYHADHIRKSRALPPPRPFDTINFLSSIVNVNTRQVRLSVQDLIKDELPPITRENIRREISSSLRTTTRGSQQHSNLLIARRELNRLPPVSPERIRNERRYRHLPEKLGHTLVNLPNVELRINTPIGSAPNPIQISLYNKYQNLRDSLQTREFRPVPGEFGTFRHHNFTQTLPALTPEEEQYLLNEKLNSDSHRWRDLHPTSEVFI